MNRVLLFLIMIFLLYLLLNISNENFSNDLFNFSLFDNNLKIKKLHKNDTVTIINFLKSRIPFENILIPKNVSYIEYENKYVFKKIKIKCFNNEDEHEMIVDFEFIPTINDTFISDQYLFGKNGMFILQNNKKINEIQDNKLTDTNIESVFNDIPEIIHLSENSDELDSESPTNTTDSFLKNINFSSN